MQAVIRSFESPDLELDLGVPPDLPSLFLRMLIGPADTEGEEIFDLTVCTPGWLADRVSSGPVSGRHMLIVQSIDLEQIKKFLTAAVAELDEPEWDSLADKLSRIGAWEYEDYQE